MHKSILPLLLLFFTICCIQTMEKDINVRLFDAIDQDDISMIGQLKVGGADFNITHKNGHTPLLYAAVYGKKGVIETLIQVNADPNKQASNGNFPLHGVSLFGCAEEHKKIVTFLVNSKADINARTTKGDCTPLHTALMQGNEYMASAFIDAGADLTMQESDAGDTPLHVAVRRGCTKIVKKLIACSVDVDKQNKRGESPLFIALVSDQKNIMQELLKAGSDPFTGFVEEIDKDCKELVIGLNETLEDFMKRGCTTAMDLILFRFPNANDNDLFKNYIAKQKKKRIVTVGGFIKNIHSSLSRQENKNLLENISSLIVSFE